MELFNPAVAVESLGPLLAGLLMTVELTIVVMALSLVFALLVALGGMSRFWPLRWAVKTYIVGPDGIYRFPALATNVDYEVYAQSNGKSSDTKRMSQFDDRKVVDIVLRIDTR